MSEQPAARLRRTWAVVPCAGSGSRAGTPEPKQYQHLAGRAVVAHTLQALLAVPSISAVLVVLAADDARFASAASGLDPERCWPVRCGGATRADSVAAGLAALQARGAHEADAVLVHDAARCLLRPAWVQRLIDACVDDAAGGLLALPLADTLKHACRDDPGRAAGTLERSGKWLAQTPQLFPLGLLQRALAQAGSVVTDEAGAVEALGLRPRLVPGEIENLKLTWPGDFALAERLLATRGD